MQDSTDVLENGITGVVVELLADLDGDGVPETVVATDTTDADGNYFFDMLPGGTYAVNIPNTPDGFDGPSTPVDATDTDDDLQNGADNGDGSVTSAPFDLSAGDEPVGDDEGNQGGDQDDADDEDGNMTIDFGFVPNLSIGSTVFYDLDGDGLQDEDNPLESGIDSVLVFLSIDTSDAMDGSQLVVIDSVLTDPDGNYLFDSLPEGNYVVSVVPADDAPTSPMTESGLDDDVDGVDDGIQLMPGDTTRSPLIMLTAGDEPGDEPFQGGTQDDGPNETNGNQTIDFAFVPNQSIGSTVFFDMDDNGMQDADDPQEMGIPNVTVQLLADLNGDGTIDQSEVVATTTTDDMGNYLFDSLPSGDYQLLIPMVDDAAMNSSTDIATSGDDNQTDGDDNGIQLVPGGAVLSPVITLSPGDEPVGDAEGGQGGDQDDGALTDANGDMTVDFGFVPMLSVGSTVFYDVDDNGVQDDDNPLETGIEDVQVFLVQVLEDAAGMDSLVVIDSVLTDDMGNYLFDSLSPGDYQIRVNVTPEDAQTSSAGSTPADDDVDSVDDGDQDVVGGPVTTATFTLSVGDEPAGDDEDGQGGNQDDGPDDLNGNMTIDLGFVPDLSVGSTVFFDVNNDGMQDSTNVLENGITGVVVELLADLDGDGIPETVVATDTTDADGNYFFDMLPGGTYAVSIPSTPDGFDGPSTPVDATDTDDDLQNGADNGDGSVTSSPFELSAGDEPVGDDEGNQGGDQDDADDEDGNMTIDFGFVPNLSIGSTVFYDLDGDGLQDEDNPLESGIDSVLVFLSIDTSDAMDGSQLVVIDSVLTDPDGNYLFDTLPEGNYVVSVVPADDAPTSPMTESGLDDDVDGVDDGIQLMPGDTTRSPLIMLTAGDEPGDEPFQGGTQDDGPNETNGNQTIDFAFVPNQSIGSTVFFDMDDNGMQDADDPQEMGIPNVTVQLLADLNGDGTIDQSEVVATTTTDDMGNYLFDSLPSGDYQLLIPMVDDAAMNSSTDIATSGDDNQTDGDDNGIQLVPGGAVLSPVITLSPGDEPVGDAEGGQGGDQDDGALTDANGDMTVDFGFVPMLSVGSTVFYDVDDNGVQDDDNPLETGIEDVQVFLVQVLEDAAGMDSLVVIDSVLTDDMGNYLFDSLSPGDYQIRVNVTPEDAQTSSAGSTPADDDVDSVDDGDQDMVGGPVTTATFTLSVGDEPAGDDEDGQGGNQDDGPDDLNGNMTIDLGFVPDLSVGSTVFFDVNNDGMQDSTNVLENGITGVVVELLADLDGDGVPETVVATDTTDADGNYFFDMLPERNLRGKHSDGTCRNRWCLHPGRRYGSE